MKAMNAQRQMQKGFTLIEFIVILGIFATMAGVVLFNFRGFQSNVGLTNTAGDIALELRTAQTLGMSAVSDATQTDQTVSFIADGQTISVVREYDGNPSVIGSSDIVVRSSTLSGYQVSQIEIGQGGAWSAVSGGVSVSFIRPNPEPNVFVGGASGQRTGVRFTVVKVGQSSPQYVVIEPSGRISIE